VSAPQTDPEAHWFDAFPLETAEQAATAICKSWEFLVSKPLHFHAKMTEPRLTKAVNIYVEQVAARQVGLLGMWAAENVIGVIDEATGEVQDERHTDITYGWTDAQSGFQLVFEFKKLTQQAKSRAAYIGPKGMGRFVSGLYSKGQPVAAMIGMLVDAHAKVVPPLLEAIETTASISTLKSIKVKGKISQSPSTLFAEAQFDSDHTRHSESNSIRIAHLFLPFPV
jgi:hypothetical protein